MEKEVTPMISRFFHTLLYTLGVVLAIVITVAMLYVTMWFMVGIAVVLLFLSIHSVLQAKDSL